jgi:hypothetical protein
MIRKLITAYAAKTAIALAMVPGIAHAQSAADPTDVKPGTHIVRELHNEDGWVVREIAMDDTGEHVCMLRRGNAIKRFQINAPASTNEDSMLIQDQAIDWVAGVYQVSIDGVHVIDLNMVTTGGLPHGIIANGVASPDKEAAMRRFDAAMAFGKKMTFDFGGNGTVKPIHFTVNLTGMMAGDKMLESCSKVVRAANTARDGV